MAIPAHHIPQIFSHEGPYPDDAQMTIDIATEFFNRCTATYYFLPDEVPDSARQMAALMVYYGEMMNGGFSQFYYNHRANFLGIMRDISAVLDKMGDEKHSEFLARRIDVIRGLPGAERDEFLQGRYFGSESAAKEVRKRLDDENDWFYDTESDDALIEACAHYLTQNGVIEFLPEADAHARLRHHIEAIPDYPDRLLKRPRGEIARIHDFMIDHDPGARLVPGPRPSDAETGLWRRRLGELVPGTDFSIVLHTLTTGRVWAINFRDFVEFLDARKGTVRAIYPVPQRVQERGGFARLALRPGDPGGGGSFLARLFSRKRGKGA